jgi:hypothetical protein
MPVEVYTLLRGGWSPSSLSLRLQPLTLGPSYLSYKASWLMSGKW